MIIEHRGLPRYVSGLGVFSMHYLVIMPLFFLGDVVIFFSVRAWLIVSVLLVVLFGAWFLISLLVARRAIARYVDRRNELARQFALFFLFPMSSASDSLATSHIQLLSVAAAIVLAVKGAWLYIIWCAVRFFAVDRVGALLNPTFQARTREEASVLFAVLEDVQRQSRGLG